MSFSSSSLPPARAVILNSRHCSMQENSKYPQSRDNISRAGKEERSPLPSSPLARSSAALRGSENHEM